MFSHLFAESQHVANVFAGADGGFGRSMQGNAAGSIKTYQVARFPIHVGPPTLVGLSRCQVPNGATHMRRLSSPAG